MPLPGYHSCYLRVDLTTRSAEVRPLSESVLRRYIGGVGLGTWLVMQEGLDGVDPFDPRMPVAFVFSPLVGTTLTTSAKFAVVGKSPLTHRLSDSLSSSHFAIAGKRAGYDAIVVVGAADEPLALRIDGTQRDHSSAATSPVEFISARAWWGLPSRTVGEQIREIWGPRFRVAAIGPAGERRVRYATISSEGRHAGRGGLGAVLGAKYLKAIAVAGDRLTPQTHSDELIAYSRELSQRSFGPATEKYRELGTVSNLLTFNRLGTLPTRNFQSGEFEGAAQLSPETFVAEHPRTRASCAACTIGCEHLFHGRGSNKSAGVRLEYESLFALGPLCGISSPDTVLQATAICDEIGIDTISAGATLAFAMECNERGLTGEDMPLRFGDDEALLTALRSIGERRGIGDLLAEGSRNLSLRWGPEAVAIAPHVKGLEIPGYEPRALQSMALGFAVGTRGADHNRSGAYQVDFSNRVDRFDLQTQDVHHAIETEDEAAVMDSLILCKFLRGVFTDKYAEMARMLSLVVGWSVDTDELHTTARRIVQLRKWYNIRHGWTPAEDTLPARFLEQPLTGGASSGARLTTERLRELIAAYNTLRGWTAEGWIPDSQIADLQ
ncbi:MAG: aldehyde ferredoxin oxidoreductase family protein [Planctomycetaceae bacterium]